uniref:Uncharacterized LOC107691522 n=1 Tax=Sinocyclocheilus anshuiensis TaxID=1608454 RepID=A0A671LNY7_9TELE
RSTAFHQIHGGQGSCSVPADSDALAIDVSVLLCRGSAGSAEADQASRRQLHQSSLESQRPALPLHSDLLLQERQEPPLQVRHAVTAYQNLALCSSLCSHIYFFLFRTYDAFSTFYVGSDGRIHRHKVEKVMEARPPLLPKVTSVLAGALVALGIQEHRPALNLLLLLLSSLRQPQA